MSGEVPRELVVDGPAGADVVLDAAGEEGLGEADVLDGELGQGVVAPIHLGRPAGVGEDEPGHLTDPEHLAGGQDAFFVEDPALAVVDRVEDPVAGVVDDVELADQEVARASRGGRTATPGRCPRRRGPSAATIPSTSCLSFSRSCSSLQLESSAEPIRIVSLTSRLLSHALRASARVLTTA